MKTTTPFKPERVSEGPRVVHRVEDWKPIASAPEKRWVLVRGDSGYMGCKVFVTIAKCDREFRPLSPWADVQNSGLSDRGWTPLEWTEVPKSWLTLPEADAYDKLAQQLGVSRDEAKKQALAMGFSVIEPKGRNGLVNLSGDGE
jgi:hypothetical protein